MISVVFYIAFLSDKEYYIPYRHRVHQDAPAGGMIVKHQQQLKQVVFLKKSEEG